MPIPQQTPHKLRNSGPGVLCAVFATASPVGIKLVLHWGHLQDDGVPEIATTTSLVVIAVVLFITTVASVIKVRRDPSARAHAGSLRAHAERDPERATER